MRFCTNCGQPLPDPAAAFCPECGVKITDAENTADGVLGTSSVSSAEALVSSPAQGYYPPSPNVNAKKKKKGHGCLISLLIFVLVLVLLFCGFIKPGFIRKAIKRNKPLPEKFRTGSYTGQAAGDSFGASVGSTEENGWNVEIPAGVFPDGSNVSVKVLSAEEAKKEKMKGADFLGTPVNVSVNSYTGYLFDGNVKLTLDIPESQIDDASRPGEYFAAIREEGGEWRYIYPESIDLKNCKMVISVPHFSDVAGVKPTKEERIKLYAEKYGMRMAEKNSEKQKSIEQLSPYFEEKVKGLGLADADARELAKSLVGWAADGTPLSDVWSLGSAAYDAYEKNDPDSFNNAANEYIAEKLCDKLLKANDENGNNFFSKLAVSSTCIASAAGYIAEGDYKGAAQQLTDKLVGIYPQGAVLNNAAKYVVHRVGADYAAWKGDMIDELYEKYKNGYSVGWHEVSPQNFDELWEYVDFGYGFLQDRGAYRLYNSDKIAEVCAMYGWDYKTYDELPQNYKDEFDRRARASLEEYFKDRLSMEEEAAKIAREEEKFLDELDYMITGSAYSRFFGEPDSMSYDLDARLDRIYRVRNLALEYVDVGKQKKKWVSDSDLVAEWVSLHLDNDPKTAKLKFIKYLDKEGILSEDYKVFADIKAEELCGDWALNIYPSEVSSEFVETLIDSILGEGAHESVMNYADETDAVECCGTITSLGKNKLRLQLTSYFGEGEYLDMIYEGTLKGESVKFKLKSDNSAYADAGISIAMPQIVLNFTRTGHDIAVDGTSNINSFIVKATMKFTGLKLDG